MCYIDAIVCWYNFFKVYMRQPWWLQNTNYRLPPWNFKQISDYPPVKLWKKIQVPFMYISKYHINVKDENTGQGSYLNMVKKGTNNLQQSVNFARIIKQLKSPALIKHFIQNTNDDNLADFFRIAANLLHNERFASNSLVKKKLPKLRQIMAPFKKKWLKVTKSASVSPRQKRKFLIEQSANGSILKIISSLLPLLLSLI